MLFVLGALVGFPVLVIGIALLLCAEFAAEVFAREAYLIPIVQGVRQAEGTALVSFKARSWLARHVHSPSHRVRLLLCNRTHTL